MTISRISKDKEVLERALKHPRSKRNFDDVVSQVLRLVSAPPEGSSFPRVSFVSSAIAASKVDQWAGYHDLMLINLLMWRWLEKCIYDSTSGYEDSQFYSAGIKKLYGDIDAYSKSLRASNELDPKEYLPGCDSSIPVYTLMRQAWRCDAPELTIKILARWLGFAHETRYEACFVQQIVEYAGVEVLVLPETELARKHLRSQVLEFPRRAAVKLAHIQAWGKEKLSTHSVCTDKSLRDVILDIYDKVKDVSLLHDLRSAAARLGVTSSTPSRTPDSSTSNNIGQLNPTALEQFVRALKVVLPALKENSTDLNSMSATTLDDKRLIMTSSFCQSVKAAGDQQIPIRALTPSLSRVLRGDGPYSPSYKCTSAGMFSALVYRGITHGTEFLFHSSPLFSDLSSFEQSVLECSPARSAHYFCNPQAYGQHGLARSLSHASDYWNIANNPQFNHILSAARPCKFMDIYWDWKGKIPGYDSAVLYALLADYAEAGLLTIPTLEDMAELIKDANLGALEGLRWLGWNINSSSPSVDILKAFKTVTELLHGKISHELEGLTEFNALFVEHALSVAPLFQSDLLTPSVITLGD